MIRGTKPKNFSRTRKSNTFPNEYVSNRIAKTDHNNLNKPEIVKNSSKKLRGQISVKQHKLNYEQLNEKAKIIATKRKITTTNGNTQILRPIVETSLTTDDKYAKSPELSTRKVWSAKYSENAMAKNTTNFRGVNKIEINRRKGQNTNKKKLRKFKNSEVETYEFIPQPNIFVHILSAFISHTLDYCPENMSSINITSHIPKKTELYNENNFAQSAFTILLKNLHTRIIPRTSLKAKALDFTRGSTKEAGAIVWNGREKKKPKKSLAKKNSQKETIKNGKTPVRTNVKNKTIATRFPKSLDDESITFPKKNISIFEKRNMIQCMNELLSMLENLNFNNEMLLIYNAESVATSKNNNISEISSYKKTTQENNLESSRTEHIATEKRLDVPILHIISSSYTLESDNFLKIVTEENNVKNYKVSTALQDHSLFSAGNEEVKRSSKCVSECAEINQKRVKFEKESELDSVSNHKVFNDVEAEEITRWIKNISTSDNSIKTLYIRKPRVHCNNYKNILKQRKPNIKKCDFKTEVMSFLVPNTVNEEEKYYCKYFEERKTLLESVVEEPISLELPSIKLKMPKFSQFMPEIGTAIKEQMSKFLTNNRFNYHEMSLGDHNFKRDSQYLYQTKIPAMINICQ